MTESRHEPDYFAKCAGCGLPTKQQVVRLSRDDGGTHVIPVYHSECVPDQRKSGRPLGRNSDKRTSRA